MAGWYRGPRQSSDELLRWLVGAALGLAALHGILVLFWGRGPIVAELPWYAPLMHGFLALAALSVAFLSFGRYQVLHEAASFWVGTAFSAFAILSLFYVASWPGLLPGELGLIAQLPNTAAWLYDLQFTALALFLVAAAFVPWPRAGTKGERWWFWLMLAGMVVMAAMGWLSAAFEQFLPLLVADGIFTPLEIGWLYALATAFTVGALLSAYRYRQTGDSLLGYLAATQLAVAFAVLTAIIGGQRYDTWWYWQRILLVGGLSAMLFGLLSEYVGLYRRERERTRQLRVLIDTAPIGIVFYLATDRRPVLFNKAIESILGQPLAPDVGLANEAAHYGIYRPTGESFPPEELPASRSLRGETCVGVEMVIQQSSGRRVYILANSAPLRNAEGQIVGAVVAYQDITAIKEQERLRDEFISAAAHELKTPVTTIKGYAQMMRKWAPVGHEPRERLALATIDVQCDRLNRRVQEMLEAVRFRTMPPELRRVRSDLGELASEVVQGMQATTQLHRLLLQREGLVPVESDRERIEEVLVSLLDNAVKFSPQGGDIEVKVWTQEGEGVVSVRDHGVGIAKERQPHIFEPFYEVVAAGAPGYRRVVALSLYLSKLAIERHKGHIWFESEEGKGSAFYFSLPVSE